MKRREANCSGVNAARVLIDHHDLMERICAPLNLNEVFRQVKRNKGSSGVDKLSIQAPEAYLRQAGQAQSIRKCLLVGQYEPQLNCGVKISKARGDER